jgi:hypothetical protein
VSGGSPSHGSKALYFMIANAWVKLADQVDVRQLSIVPLKVVP